MNYCVECGTKLIKKPLENEGIIPYCPKCRAYRFPIYNTAVSMEVLNPTRDKIALIQQYGRKRNILVAGYVNRGESVENTVAREVSEELGLEVSDIHFSKSKFFEPSNTLMLNFSCVAESERFRLKEDEVDKAGWFTFEEAKQNIAENSLAEQFLLYFLENYNG